MKAFAAYERERLFVISGNRREEKLFVLADGVGFLSDLLCRAHSDSFIIDNTASVSDRL
jgi:hypothetical protein